MVKEENILENNEKYQTIVKISKRARQLVDGEEPLVKAKSQNPVMIALQEIQAGKVVEAEKEDIQ